MTPVWSAVVAAVVSLGVAYLTYLASRRNHKGDLGQKMIDQHQEDIKELRAELVLVRRALKIQGDYIGQLRQHIADGHPPPPPAWPEGLIA